MFFFRPKSPEKAENECCSIEHPKKFFNLACKTVFNKFCSIHEFCVCWTLLIQYLSACKSLIPHFFKPKLHYQTLYLIRCESANNCKVG